jgi:hypothetical protein
VGFTIHWLWIGNAIRAVRRGLERAGIYGYQREGVGKETVMLAVISHRWPPSMDGYRVNTMTRGCMEVVGWWSESRRRE